LYCEVLPAASENTETVISIMKSLFAGIFWTSSKQLHNIDLTENTTAAKHRNSLHKSK